MIIEYDDYLLEATKAKPLRADLIIVDIQKAFSEFFTDDYVKAVKMYCKTFDRVFQIWDSHKEDSPSYTFPKQTVTVEKRFGFKMDDLQSHFLPHVAEEILSKKEYTIGEKFSMKNGGYVVYIGNKHKWFECSPELISLFKRLRHRQVVLIGGSGPECLRDISVSAKSFGVNIVVNNDYVYSATYCPTYTFEEPKVKKVLKKTTTKKK